MNGTQANQQLHLFFYSVVIPLIYLGTRCKNGREVIVFHLKPQTREPRSTVECWRREKRWRTSPCLNSTFNFHFELIVDLLLFPLIHPKNEQEREERSSGPFIHSS